MKKIFLSLLCLSLLGAMPVVAYAEVDEYGNEIDWIDDGVSGEDLAGEENNYIPPNADQLEVERLEQSESEAESIAEIINQNKSESGASSTITLKFDASDNWRGSNVMVSLYNKDTWTQHKVYIYKQNNYVAMEELPFGTYELRGAEVVGDTNGVYPLISDANGRNEFEVGENQEAVVINVELAKRITNQEEQKHQEEKEKEEDNEIQESESKEKHSLFTKFIIDNVPFLIFGILVGSIFYRFKRKQEE